MSFYERNHCKQHGRNNCSDCAHRDSAAAHFASLLNKKEENMKTTIKVQTTVNCPRVPNFLQREDGTWIPLCALNDDGLIELSQAWLNSCRERAKEQSKDKDFFYKNAVKGES